MNAIYTTEVITNNKGETKQFFTIKLLKENKVKHIYTSKNKATINVIASNWKKHGKVLDNQC